MVARAIVRWILLATVAVSLFAAGCGHSEDEWNAKLKEVEALNAKLKAEQKVREKTQSDYNDAKATIAELRERLKRSGLDVEQLNSRMSEQDKALQEFKRRADQLEAIRLKFEQLRAKLESLVRLGLSVSVRNNRMVITMPGDVLFDPGKVDVKEEGKQILKQVADVVRNDNQLNARRFQVAGHTDAKPLGGGPYKDNWGLSVMRAREVLIFLIGRPDKGGGLNPNFWSASGYGDTDPIAPNDTPDNMRKNRRVELVVMPNMEEMLDIQSLMSK